MDKDKKNLFKSKTFWTIAVGIVVAFVTFLTGEITFEAFLGSLFAAAMAIFYRADMGTNLRTLLNGYFSKVQWLKDGVFWTMLVGVLGSITAWLTGTIEFVAMATTVFIAVVGFFFRSATIPEST